MAVPPMEVNDANVMSLASMLEKAQAIDAATRQQAEQFGVEILQAQDVVKIHSHDNW